MEAATLWRRARRAAGVLPAALAAGLIALTTCTKGTSAQAPALTGSEPSLDALAGTAWAALQAGDTAALARLRLTEEEHNARVWPELPAADPAVNYPVDQAWQNIELRDRAALERLLPRWRGSGHKLEGIRCVGDPAPFRSFEVLQDCWLKVRAPGGRAEDVQLFKDVLVRGGEHKVFRYYAD